MGEDLRALLQVLLRVDDAFVGAALLAVGDLLRGRGGRDDARAHGLADLDGGGADAAGRAEDEQRLSALQLGAVDERVHGGRVREERRGADVERHGVGQKDGGGLGDDDLLGERSGHERGGDAIAGGERADVLADGAHDAVDYRPVE